MTGDCRNTEALDLIRKCCKRYLEAENGSSSALKINCNNELEEEDDDYIPATKEECFNDVLEVLDGTNAPIDNTLKFASSLEGYILFPSSKPYLSNIISYLKDETQELIIK